MQWLPLTILGALTAWRVYQAIRDHLHGHALLDWARQKKWRLDPAPDADLGRTYLELPLLSDGPATASYQARGTWQGHQVHLFDLDRRRRPGQRHGGIQGRFTCVVVQADLPLIPLRIRPEKAADRLAAALGQNDIDFESAAFSDAYHVTSPDRKWAYDVLHPRQMEFLLQQPRCWLELGGWWCLVAIPGRLTVAEIPAAIATATGFLERIPDFVRRELVGSGLVTDRRQRA